MLLVFTAGSIEKIRMGQKWTTIRRNADRWNAWRTHPNRDKDDSPLQVWESNPRNGGRFVAETHCSYFWVLHGASFPFSLAQSDGFDSVQALKERLAELNGMTLEEVDRHLWAVIGFDPKPIMEHGGG
jgi:hypothetical protein